MIFHTFNSSEQRRDFGGSAFIEMQFCKLPSKAAIDQIVAVSSITNWQDDSLYIHDIEKFEEDYGNIFDCGIYNNLKNGIVDLYGINYYKPDMIKTIVTKILEDKPTDYEILLEWLSKAKSCNGFYILGI